MSIYGTRGIGNAEETPQLKQGGKLQAPFDPVFEAAGEDEFLSGGTDGRERVGFLIRFENRAADIYFRVKGGALCGLGRTEPLPQIPRKLGRLENEVAVVDGIALVGFAEGTGEDEGNAEIFEGGGGLLA